MPIPSAVTDLNVTASVNSPQSTESAKGSIDNYFRSHAAFIRQTYNLAAGATTTLPSAATVNIGFAATNNIAITGTTTITAFDSYAEGAIRNVTFSGALTLTHNGTSLILPGAANITTVAGDSGVFKSLGGGNWKCLSYQRSSGSSVAAPTAASLVCTATNDAAAAGAIGEYQSSTVLFSSRFSLPSATATTVASLSLTAGDWDLAGHIGFSTDPTTNVTRLCALVSTAVAYSNDADGAAQLIYQPGSVLNTAANGTPILAPNQSRISLSATTTVYLVAYGVFTVAAMGVFGHINARRVR